MKKVLLVSCIVSSSSLFAAPLEQLSTDALKQDARSYSILHGVSSAEANRAMVLDANRDVALDAIEKEFKGRIAGIYVESVPTYKVVVRVKGYGKNEQRSLAVGNTSAKNLLPIEVKYGATETRESGRAQMSVVKALAQKYFDNAVQFIVYDEKSGNMLIEIKGKESAENLKKVDQLKTAWGNQNLPLNIKFVNTTIKPLVNANGGAFVVDKSNPNMWYDCTTAFGIKNSAGTKYMSTAAHCPNNFQDKSNGTPYTFVNEIPFSSYNDFQWNSTTATITNKFNVSPTTLRTLTGRRTLGATKVGDSVCHYGVATGYSCGTVSAVGTDIPAYDPVTGQPQFPGLFWVRVDTNTCGHSDSGGPVFTALTIASGILSLGAMDDTTGQCQGYFYVPTDKIYENGFSFVY